MKRDTNNSLIRDREDDDLVLKDLAKIEQKQSRATDNRQFYMDKRIQTIRTKPEVCNLL